MTDIEQALAEALREADGITGANRGSRLFNPCMAYSEAAAAILATEPMQAIARRLLDDQMADLIAALDRRNIHSAGDLFTYEKAIARESIARGKPWSYTDQAAKDAEG